MILLNFWNLLIRGRSKITSRFRGEGVGEFVTGQIQIFYFFGKFVTRGSQKSSFLRDVICERPLINNF